MSARFRFLHLSDIHYMIGPQAENQRENLIRQLEKHFREPNDLVDYVVLTGDFLQRGKNEHSSFASLDYFVKYVCEKSLKANYLSEWEKHVLVCPGNHDLDRDARFIDRGKKQSVSREGLLRKITSDSPNRMINPPTNRFEGQLEEYDFLTMDSFWLFNDVVFAKYANNQLEEPKGFGEYSVVSDLLESSDGEKYVVVLVGLNTASYAGQTRDIKSIKEDLKRTREELQTEDIQCFPNPERAKKTFGNYMRYYAELTNPEADDKEKLGFVSEKSVREIINQVALRTEDTKRYVVVFYGHHPIEWWTEEARRDFAILAKHYYTCQAPYFCGHEHKPKVHREKVSFIGDGDFDVLEHEVGGCFPDEKGWNSMSFSVNTVSLETEGKVHFEGDVLGWCQFFDDSNLDKSVCNYGSFGWQTIHYSYGVEVAEPSSFKNSVSTPFEKSDKESTGGRLTDEIKNKKKVGLSEVEKDGGETGAKDVNKPMNDRRTFALDDSYDAFLNTQIDF